MHANSVLLDRPAKACDDMCSKIGDGIDAVLAADKDGEFVTAKTRYKFGPRHAISKLSAASLRQSSPAW